MIYSSHVYDMSTHIQIERMNSGEHPSLQIFYELVTILDVSVDQFFFPNKETEKSTQRRQLESLLDEMDDKDLTIMTATAKGIQEAKSEERTEN